MALNFERSRRAPTIITTFALLTFSAAASAQQAQPTAPTPPTQPPPEPEPLPSIVLRPIQVPRLRVRSVRFGTDESTPTTARARSYGPDAENPNAPVSPATPDDPVESRRGARIAVATLATAGTVLVGGALSTLGIVVGIYGSTSFLIGTGTMACGLALFGLPAVYAGVASRFGGNGTYWSTFAGNGVGLLGIGALIGLSVSVNSSVLAIGTLVVSPVLLLAGNAVGYELSTMNRDEAARAARDAEQGRERGESVFTNQTSHFRVLPAILLTETTRGVSFVGSF